MQINIQDMKNYLFLLILSTTFIFSCADDPLLSKYENVDTRLWIYFERFDEEASERGIEIDFSDIRGTIQDIPINNVAGSCAYGQNHEHHDVVIDLPYWQASNDLEREYVVFHELGHCILFRAHQDASDTFGNCVSIMYSGLGGCQDNYDVQNREILLDELFQ